MFNHRLMAVGFVALIFLSTGCSNTESESTNDVKDIQKKSPATITEQISTELKLRGQFKRSFEVYEMEANNKVYYVADPKNFLMKSANKIGQDGYYKSFEACVVGEIISEGGYGPTGKYENKITVSDLCV